MLFPATLRPPHFLQAGIFQYAKQITDAQAGESVVDTVVVVPAWFGVAQRQAVIDAASLAGLNVLGLMNGHAAAALQYGIERDFAKKEQTVRADASLRSQLHLNQPLQIRFLLGPSAPKQSRGCRCSCWCVLQQHAMKKLCAARSVCGVTWQLAGGEALH
jgi:hypothetical protein